MIEMGYSSIGTQIYLNTDDVSIWFNKEEFIKAVRELDD